MSFFQMVKAMTWRSRLHPLFHEAAMRSLVFGIVLLGVLTPMARGQTAQESRPRLAAGVVPLRAGVTVRIAEGPKRGDWQFVRLAGDSITVTSTVAARRVALGDIDTLWVWFLAGFRKSSFNPEGCETGISAGLCA
jgi:hypothetical protein